MKLWDLRSPTYSRSFDCRGPVNSVALHPNQALILSGDQNGSLKVWDLGTSKCINDLCPDSSNTDHHNKHNNGNKSVGMKNSKSNNETRNISRVSIQSVDISEDGRTCIAATNHANVFVWDPTRAEEFKPITKFRAHPIGTYLLKARISPDCRHLVTTSSDRTARLWDTTTWDLSQTLAQHTKWVWDAVFSADSNYLVTASSDNSARLWNLRTGDVVRQYNGHQTAVTCVALNDSST